MSIITLIPTVTHTLQVERDACFWLENPASFSRDEAELYSRLKYGDASATQRAAEQIFTHLQKSVHWSDLVASNGDLLLSPSAFGAIPTAAFWMTEFLGQHLAGASLDFETVRFLRSGGFECHNYSRMGLEDRKKALAQREVWLDPEVETAGKTLLVLDDLRSTGAHESMLLDSLKKHTQLRRVIFLYWVGFTPHLAMTAPQTEDALNNSKIADVADLAASLAASEQPPLINARLVRFLLKNGSELTPLLPKFDLAFLQAVATAAISSDGYAWRENYRLGYQALQDYLNSIEG